MVARQALPRQGVFTDSERLTRALSEHYRIERELGRGGMAIVFLAEDLKHRRPVAVKVLHPQVATWVGAERFLREIELTARLDHPHIVPLLDSGTSEGFVYFVLPYVEGESLRDRLVREKQLAVDDAVQIAREVADALSYAHGHGVVHRDVKPENILLSGGHARLADFGIARALTAPGAERLTETGLAIGTAEYMSPEQATGERDLDGRADVYSLSCVLYEMLAGKPPYTGPTVESVVQQHLAAEPQPIRRIRPAVPPALEGAIFRGLAKTPADRYPSATLFASAIAHVDSATLPFRDRITPRRRTVVLLGVAALASVALLVVVIASRPPRAPSILIGASTQLTFDDGLEIDPAISPDGKLFAFASGMAAHMRIYLRPITGGRTIPLSEDSAAFEFQPRWSPDGSRILYLTPSGAFVASVLGGAARLIAPPATRSEYSGFDFVIHAVNAAAWSPDGQRIFVARGRTLSTIDRDGGAERALGMSPDALHSCDWSPRGDWIACASGNWDYVLPGRNFGNLAPSAIVLVSPRTGAVVEVTGRGSLHQSPVWSPDGQQLYFVSSRDGPRDIYELEISKLGKPRHAPGRITVGLNAQSIAFTDDGRRMVYVVYTARANAWSLPIPSRGSADLSTATQVTSGNQIVESMRVSLDGRWLLYDSNLHGNGDVFRVPTKGGIPERLTSESADDFAGDLSPDGRELAFHSWRSGSRDIFVQPLRGGPVQQVTATSSHESFPVWSPDGRAIVFADQLRHEGRARGAFVTRRDETGRWTAPLSRRTGTFSVTWSPDGEYLVLDRDGAVEAVPADSGPPRVVYAPRPGTADPHAASVALSEDGQTVFFKSHDVEGHASIWAVGMSGGRPRLLVRFDRSRASVRRFFAAGAGRLFFPIEDRQSDLWIVDVTRQ